MPTSKVIILTGASRGIGLAAAKFLLQEGHRLVVVARTAGPMEELKGGFPGKVEIVVGDATGEEVPQKAVSLALSSFSRLDGLILNHGTLEPVARIADATASAWRAAFDTNVFSCISFIQAALPSLRESGGRIIAVSSGAATNSYAGWGAYGATKAALNHLVGTVEREEGSKGVVAVAVRPGVVDTEMQRDIREVHGAGMDEGDVARFKGLKEEGGLLRPEQPGNVLGRLAVEAEKELGGKFLSWNAPELVKFQDKQ
ncbi:hypothetical protein V501_03645 [Pseudogymnoascus sp. VKM F-4519 (FW-2642)]|nr:hypothetical protein V501_03645 [Pseudogymnoascus sp. VKM F-4519 (FW-2642)]